MTPLAIPASTEVVVSQQEGCVEATECRAAFALHVRRDHDCHQLHGRATGGKPFPKPRACP